MAVMPHHSNNLHVVCGGQDGKLLADSWNKDNTTLLRSTEMTVSEAAKKWRMTVWQVRKMCRAVGIQKNTKGYIISDDMLPVYIPDMRKYRKNHSLRLFCYVLDAITDGLMLDYQLLASSEVQVRTVVRELKENGLIVLLDGKSEASLNYTDYYPSMKCGEWQQKRWQRNTRCYLR